MVYGGVIGPLNGPMTPPSREERTYFSTMGK